MINLTALFTNTELGAGTKHSFLDYPPEIRNQIYELVFGDIEDEVIIPIHHKRTTTGALKRWATPRGKRVPHLALLMTCRQIRAEAFEYVHGVVRAELNMDYTRKQRFYEQAERESLAHRLKLCVHNVGECLPFVTHLNLAGTGMLRLLSLEPSDKVVASWTRKQAKLHDRFYQVRRYLPNVQCVTITSWAFEEGGRLRDLDMWLFFVLRLSKERADLAAAFPRLTDIRLASKSACMRFRRVGWGEQWFEWYTHKRTQCLGLP